ncbi:MAG: FAD-dependent oxidoreductase [Hamadaea sp.]|uniref:NAD(P)/FAD-dependent oxidoreductase n=1 Tax=Hamadaea sp. TaxID=2024425 RepID=UPI001795719E|nr:FAD-dependent oxidoreductase [Hamadaea sp.]NUR69961.1 FAD-dependent oxidoreductase [Hamadaea sp.]NUT20657.1 FAD-dependent oxidoreductase [Hamadaea sp.]
MRQTVAVVGGGYGGIEVARGLDEFADVVLIEPRQDFHHNAAALRAVVRPDFAHQTFIPYDKLLVHGRVERDAAAQVSPGSVRLASGRAIDADYIVLATGVRHPFPGKPSQLDTPEAVASYAQLQAQLAAADRILLAGAGPIGLELAGEIKAEWPGKEVVLVDPAPSILPERSAELRAEIERQLAELGVTLVLGAALPASFDVAPGTLAPFTVELTDGRSLSADLWLRCYGTNPAADYLADSLQAARLPNGLVRVTQSLRLHGQDRVYAIGDMTDVAEPKQAVAAMAHAAVVVANIKADLGLGESTVYEPAGSSILIPLGPSHGAGEHPGMGVLGSEVTAQYKGGDLLLGHYNSVFNR